MVLSGSPESRVHCWIWYSESNWRTAELESAEGPRKSTATKTIEAPRIGQTAAMNEAVAVRRTMGSAWAKLLGLERFLFKLRLPTPLYPLDLKGCARDVVAREQHGHIKSQLASGTRRQPGNT